MTINSTPSIPLVTIVTPSLNQGEYISQAIESVLSQNYPAIEYIVIDGCSEDDTTKILSQYGDKLAWLSEKDNGLYDAVNKGWAIAHGKYLGYLNCDDVLLPYAITNMVNYLEQNKSIPLVFGDYFRIDQTDRVIEKVSSGKANVDTLLKYGNTIFTGSMLVRQLLLQDIGYFNTSYKYAADYDFCIRVAMRYKIDHISTPLAQFRIHIGSKSQNSKWKMWEETLRISNNYSGKKYFTLYSRYFTDRVINLLPRSFLWSSISVPQRKYLRRIWKLGN